jgi:hypothetical protein
MNLYLRSYQIREQETNDAIERKRQSILAQRKAQTVQATMRFQRNLPGFTVMGKFIYLFKIQIQYILSKILINLIVLLKLSPDVN